MADLIGAARQSSQTGETVALTPYKDEVLGVLIVGTKNAAACVHALDGLREMVATPGLLSDEERGFVVHSVNELFAGDVTEMGEDVRCASLLPLPHPSNTLTAV